MSIKCDYLCDSTKHLPENGSHTNLKMVLTQTKHDADAKFVPSIERQYYSCATTGTVPCTLVELYCTQWVSIRIPY